MRHHELVYRDLGVVVDGKTLLAGVTGSCTSGRFLAIMGPSGAGKAAGCASCCSRSVAKLSVSAAWDAARSHHGDRGVACRRPESGGPQLPPAGQPHPQSPAVGPAPNPARAVPPGRNAGKTTFMNLLADGEVASKGSVGGGLKRLGNRLLRCEAGEPSQIQHGTICLDGRPRDMRVFSKLSCE